MKVNFGLKKAQKQSPVKVIVAEIKLFKDIKIKINPVVKHVFFIRIDFAFLFA